MAGFQFETDASFTRPLLLSPLFSFFFPLSMSSLEGPSSQLLETRLRVDFSALSFDVPTGSSVMDWLSALDTFDGFLNDSCCLLMFLQIVKGSWQRQQTLVLCLDASALLGAPSKSFWAVCPSFWVTAGLAKHGPCAGRKGGG